MKQLGDKAETAVAKYLESQGFKILARNWRTRWCEIDIIAEKDKIVHFVEVKFRSGSGQGTGFDYITPKKFKQMKFAADFWISSQDYSGECALSAAEIDEYGEIHFIDDVSF